MGVGMGVDTGRLIVLDHSPLTDYVTHESPDMTSQGITLTSPDIAQERLHAVKSDTLQKNDLTR